MFHGRKLLCAVLVLLVSVALVGHQAQAESFKDQVGPVAVGNVSPDSTLQVPFITWGGDAATFYANGGLKTKQGTIFAQKGLSLNLKAGDDFTQQVRDYVSGKSPFLRGTFRMMGMASEVIGADPRTKGVVILQMTWSAGDHMVARSNIKTVKDLKGTTIVMQKGGPHVGMLDDILKTGQLSWSDVTIVWAADLTATPDSPAEIFRKRSDIDACFVITPDMIGLSGGLQNTGSGAEGTVKGARVLVSTADMSRSIADVYVVRKDFYDKHKDTVVKFVAGYLMACEKVTDLMKLYESKGSPEYMKLLKMVQDIYTPEVIPTIEEDAHGLLADCSFVGYPGNVAFFTLKGNLSGFEAFQKSALDLATNQGYASKRVPLLTSGLDYNSAALKGQLTKTSLERGERFRAEAVIDEIEQLSSGGALDDRTIVSFTVSFEPNQLEFGASQYSSEYQRVVELANKYGNAVVAIRGHADPTKTLLELVKAGMSKNILKQSGSKGSYRYSLNGRPLDLTQTEALVKHIEAGSFDGVAEHNPRQTMQAALNLSLRRAQAVRDSIIDYVKSKGLLFDKSQIQPVGVGVREPFIAKPASMDEARLNMRVEFRLIRVEAEAVSQSDFDF